MLRLFVPAPILSVFYKRISLLLSLVLAVLLGSTTLSAHAQFAAPSGGTRVRDASVLKPPAGVRVAMIEFADMECPICGSENPTMKAAAARYKIPWLRHDFPLPYHPWSFEAAVDARWFDTKSKALGDEYRDQVFANQASIYNPNVLRQFTAKFAASHNIALPFAIDPQGKFAAMVKADQALAQRIGIDHTPTVFIVTSNSKGAPYVEVDHPNQDLYRIIDQAIADTASSRAPVTTSAKKPASK
jgi:protein-disulfide isomerase